MRASVAAEQHQLYAAPGLEAPRGLLEGGVEVRIHEVPVRPADVALLRGLPRDLTGAGMRAESPRVP